MYQISLKSESVGFNPLGDLTRNDPLIVKSKFYCTATFSKRMVHVFKSTSGCLSLYYQSGSWSLEHIVHGLLRKL